MPQTLILPLLSECGSGISTGRHRGNLLTEWPPLRAALSSTVRRHPRPDHHLHMYVQAIQIALSKNADSAWHRLLEQALHKAEKLALVESQLEAKINASKANRGEKPTKLSKSRRAEIDSFDNDAACFHVEQLARYKSESSAREIIATLK